MLTQAPKGTNDILPGAAAGWLDAARWHHLEREIHAICQQYGYGELRPPVFEHTELFEHGTGSTTDIVQREMFTFTKKALESDAEPRRYTLRPEFTPGLVRAYLEHGLFGQAQPTKLYTYGPAFRYENVQAGRFRQFHQWDVEVFGARDPAVDAECIQIGLALAGRLGLAGLVVQLNSIGCPNCRPAYRELLRRHFAPVAGQLCEDCQRRIHTNPLRLVDCKKDAAHPAQAGAPLITEHLCPDCAGHFAELQQILRSLDITHNIDPRIVRGLDYYTKTVFEVHDPKIGAQSAMWGGGRYDGLIEALGGKPTPGVGFALGMERLLMVLDKGGAPRPGDLPLQVFVAALGAAARPTALALLYRLRAAGIATDTDYLGRSLKAQLRHAEKNRARFVAIIGDDEVNSGQVQLKDMAGGGQRAVALADVAAAVAVPA